MRIRIFWPTLLALQALPLAPVFAGLRAEQRKTTVPVLFPSTGPYLPPRRAAQVQEPPAVLPDAAAVRRYEGCYRFELPEGFHLSSGLSEGQLEAYLTHHPLKDSVNSLRAHLHPTTLWTSGWTVRGGVAAFAWSTGTSGLDIRLDKQGALPAASAERFSDAINMVRPPARASLEVTEVPCSSLKVRKLEIWADAINLEVRRGSRSRRGSGRGSSLETELGRVQAKFGVTAAALTDIRDEGQRDDWSQSPMCAATRIGEHDLLVLKPESLSTQPPRSRGFCKRSTVWVDGIVTVAGRFTKPQADGSGSAGYDSKVSAGAVDLLKDSRWLPALLCGKPVEVRHREGVDVYRPCSAIESELGEVFPVGDEVSAPKALLRVEPDATAMRRRARSGQLFVMLTLTISKKGEVARVVIHDGYRDATDQEIIDAVMQWKYQPARRRGKPVSVTMSAILPLPRP